MNEINYNPICLDLNMNSLLMNKTAIQLLNMLQTIISVLPMNTTKITTLNANSMMLESLSIDTLAVHLVPSYWVIIVMILTITCMSLGAIMLLIKLVLIYQKFKNSGSTSLYSHVQ